MEYLQSCLCREDIILRITDLQQRRGSKCDIKKKAAAATEAGNSHKVMMWMEKDKRTDALKRTAVAHGDTRTHVSLCLHGPGVDLYAGGLSLTERCRQADMMSIKNSEKLAVADL